MVLSPTHVPAPSNNAAFSSVAPSSNDRTMMLPTNNNAGAMLYNTNSGTRETSVSNNNRTPSIPIDPDSDDESKHVYDGTPRDEAFNIHSTMIATNPTRTPSPRSTSQSANRINQSQYAQNDTYENASQDPPAIRMPHFIEVSICIFDMVPQFVVSFQFIFFFTVGTGRLT